MTLRTAASRYVEARILLTNCMQRHFRQLCNRCRWYGRCSTYSEYVQAWMDLQKAVKEEDSDS